MTNEQLIKKLLKYPMDAVITVENDSVFVSGEYKATSVVSYEEKHVTICTDYKTLIEERDY